MKAELLIRERLALSTDAFVEVLVWRVPKPVSGCQHCFKYRLAYVAKGTCRLRYDNETGKGDHKHLGRREIAYRFSTLEVLQSDFWADVQEQESRS